ncbi:MAG TPA: hypothetical protein VL918_04150, partial [Sphingobium sp.]|nr:hypothetical protein [Sphingobium sp.]
LRSRSLAVQKSRSNGNWCAGALTLWLSLAVQKSRSSGNGGGYVDFKAVSLAVRNRGPAAPRTPTKARTSPMGEPFRGTDEQCKGLVSGTAGDQGNTITLQFCNDRGHRPPLDRGMGPAIFPAMPPQILCGYAPRSTCASDSQQI